jgi:phosphoribosylcarboxyaminoimidazole (NCAIR) mutase
MSSVTAFLATAARDMMRTGVAAAEEEVAKVVIGRAGGSADTPDTAARSPAKVEPKD